MQPITVEELAACVNARWVKGNRDAQAVRVELDSRKIQPGDAFLSLVGKNVDRHQFVGQVLEAGASVALVTRDPGVVDTLHGAIVCVDDLLGAVSALARRERQNFGGPVVGVTGSNGKTTTKEMLAAVFGAAAPCLFTEGNLNTEWGLPFTLLRRESAHQAIVLEMGMRGRGQIAHLCDVARPNMGVITTIGQSHMELLGSQEAIALAKAELLDALEPDGHAILCADDPWQRRVADHCRGEVLWYGLGQDATHALGLQVTQESEGTRFRAIILGQEATVFIPTFGEHNVRNALAALLAGSVAGVSLEAALQGLARMKPSVGRLRVVSGKRNRVVLDDCYNASPASMRASLDVLASRFSDHRTVAILGEMYELGSYAETGHREVGQHVAALCVDELWTVGPMAAWIAQEARARGCSHVEHFASRDELIRALDQLPDGGAVLVKASNGMALDAVVQALCAPED